jgi:hypothetical protein
MSDDTVSPPTCPTCGFDNAWIPSHPSVACPDPFHESGFEPDDNCGMTCADFDAETGKCGTHPEERFEARHPRMTEREHGYLDAIQDVIAEWGRRARSNLTTHTHTTDAEWDCPACLLECFKNWERERNV